MADKYIAEYFRDADGLGIRRASVHPRVTENIPQIIEFIEELIEKAMHMNPQETYISILRNSRIMESSHARISLESLTSDQG